MTLAGYLLLMSAILAAFFSVHFRGIPPHSTGVGRILCGASTLLNTVPGLHQEQSSSFTDVLRRTKLDWRLINQLTENKDSPHPSHFGEWVNRYLFPWAIPDAHTPLWFNRTFEVIDSKPYFSRYLSRRSSIPKRERITILYVHGGNFISGDGGMALNSLSSFLSQNSGYEEFDIMLLSYGLAPDFPIRLMVNSLFDAHRELVYEFECNPSNIVLVGDNSGATVILNFIDEILTRKNFPESFIPKAIGLLSPLVDLSFETTMTNRSDLMMDERVVQHMNQSLYSKEEYRPERYSPVVFKKMIEHPLLPRMFISYSKCERITESVQKFIATVQKVHGSSHVTERTLREGPESFPLYHNYIDQARQSMTDMLQLFQEQVKTQGNEPDQSYTE